jgi:hypothetical protein
MTFNLKKFLFWVALAIVIELLIWGASYFFPKSAADIAAEPTPKTTAISCDLFGLTGSEIGVFQQNTISDPGKYQIVVPRGSAAIVDTQSFNNPGDNQLYVFLGGSVVQINCGRGTVEYCWANDWQDIYSKHLEGIKALHLHYPTIEAPCVE